MKRQQWTEHIFNFDIHPGWGQNLITRIADTPSRCELHCNDLSDELLSTKHDEQWSIKEHIGHLIDLEDLHLTRLKELGALKNELSPADMSNQKTNESDYNNWSLQDLIAQIAVKRQEIMTEYGELSDTCLLHKAMHPRLKVGIRAVDVLFFIGEHDDHHLASIVEIKNLTNTSI